MRERERESERESARRPELGKRLERCIQSSREQDGARPLDHFSIQEQLIRRNVKRFRGGLVFKAHRLLYHSTLGLGVIKKKRSSIRDAVRAHCNTTSGRDCVKSLRLCLHRAPCNTTSGRDCVKSFRMCLHWTCPQMFRVDPFSGLKEGLPPPVQGQCEAVPRRARI